MVCSGSCAAVTSHSAEDVGHVGAGVVVAVVNE